MENETEFVGLREKEKEFVEVLEGRSEAAFEEGWE